MGGAPAFRGTRVHIQTLFDLLTKTEKSERNYVRRINFRFAIARSCERSAAKQSLQPVGVAQAIQAVAA